MPARSHLSPPRDMASHVRRRYGAAAMAGVVTYVGVDAVLQRLPPHYSFIRDAESNLAVGPYGWIMNMNFMGRAATTLCLVRAVLQTGPASPLRSTGTVLLGIGGACSGILAFFPTDIPDAAADDGRDHGRSTANPGLSATTRPGAVHLAVTGVGFLAAFAGILVLTAWLRTCPQLRRTFNRGAGFCLLAGAGLGALGLAGRYFPACLGLAERIALAGILGWAFSTAAGLRSLPLTVTVSGRP